LPTLQVVHGDGTLSGGNQTLETPSPKQARDTLVVSSVPEKASGQQLVVWSRDGKHIEARYFRPLDAGFRAAPATGPAPLTVVFTDTTSPLDKADRWAWDFGDGHLIVAQQHPQHSYSAPGVYSVTLTVSDSRSGESESLLLPAAITVTEATIQERTITYTYDSLSRLTAATYSTGETYGYQYDPVGNRVAYTLTTPLDGTAVTTYTYDAANRLLVSASPGHSVTYTWDDRGNLLSDGMFTYTYNAAGRMVRAESVTATLAYTYTADGLRIAQAQSVSSVQPVDTFAWDWATGVPELLSDGDSLYLIGYDTLGWQTGADWTFVLPDALGSVRQEADGAGAVIAVREWTPYGEEVGAARAGLGYTGEWWDANVGFTYLRARWYEPGMGRFTSRDPWTGNSVRPMSLHRFSYALNNPIRYTDSSGFIEETQAVDADRILKALSADYEVYILRDWGYQYPFSVYMAPLTPEMCMASRIWNKGSWELTELDVVETGVQDLASAMGGASKFKENFHGVWIIRWQRWPLKQVNGFGTPFHAVFLSGPNIDQWTVVHELAHTWDGLNWGSLSRGLEEYVGAATTNWIPEPFKGMFGEYEPGTPPAKGADDLLTRVEDFSESVAAFVYPDQARQDIRRLYQNDPNFNFFNYDNYYHTLRAEYIARLLGININTLFPRSPR